MEIVTNPPPLPESRRTRKGVHKSPISVALMSLEVGQAVRFEKGELNPSHVSSYFFIFKPRRFVSRSLPDGLWVYRLPDATGGAA